MKNLITVLITACLILTTSNLKAQEEFSSGLIGIGVVVKDIEKSLDFYLHVIGMTKVGEFDVDGAKGKTLGLTDGLSFHVDILKLTDTPDANQWKLMSFGKDGSHPLPRNIEDDTGMQYTTIMVKSLKPFIKRMQEHGVKLLGDTPVSLDDGTNHFILVQDPDGTFIELIGPMN